MIKKVYIVLEDGHIFEGKRFGAEGEALGELVFTTGMGGYIETLTDPSYYGQIVMQTFPLIGNYGIMEEDFESDRSYVSGYVVREWCALPSNFRTEYDLDTFLKKQGVEVIDKRSQGGKLWITGDRAAMDRAIKLAKSLCGATGGFASGRATHQRLGWYTDRTK